MVFREKSLLILNPVNILRGQNSGSSTSEKTARIKQMCFKGQSVYTIYIKKTFYI
jgi:hypothetical protein